jgi:hypothetical protein
MENIDFNLDEIKEKISGIKDKVQITKAKDGVIFKITDPSAKDEFDPASIENLKNMMPGGAGMDIEVVPVKGGYKLKTSDPEGLYNLFQQIFDPAFLEMMLKQLMEMFKNMGSALAGLGDALGSPDQDAEDDADPDQEKDDQ